MKVDERFHCFGCQADGDVISFTSRLFDLSPKDAALELASDFGIAYDEHQLTEISWCNGRSSMLRNLQTTTFIPDFWKRYIIWMM